MASFTRYKQALLTLRWLAATSPSRAYFMRKAAPYARTADYDPQMLEELWQARQSIAQDFQRLAHPVPRAAKIRKVTPAPKPRAPVGLMARVRSALGKSTEQRFHLLPRGATATPGSSLRAELPGVTVAQLRSKFGPANVRRSSMDQDDGYGAETWTFGDDKHHRFEVYSRDDRFRVGAASDAAAFVRWLRAQLRKGST